MKTITYFSKLFVVILASVSFANNSFAQNNDSTMITKVALDYIEGWYSADTSRIAGALSNDLVKRGFLLSRKENKLVKVEATYTQMIEWTSRKPNELVKQPDLRIDVQIIEIAKNIAMAKIVSPQFIDYIHLGKLNGEWKIYNVIWEPITVN